MQLHVDAHSPIPIRRQLAEQLKHFVESGGFPREQALPSIRELAGFLGINPKTVARAIEDLKRDGYVQVRRGKGVFVAPDPPARPSPTLREAFLKEVVIRASALEMTADDLAVGLHARSRGGSRAIGGETAMWTQWGVVAFVGVAGLALVACGSRADCWRERW